MSNALARGTFVVSVELVPPRGYRAESLVEQARQLRIHGVDLVNIPGRPARDRPHERARGRRHGAAAGRRRNDPSLRLPRPQHDRHAVGPARRARDGRPQPADRDRRSAAGRGLSRRDGGVRGRLDRPDEPGRAARIAGSTSAASRLARRPPSTSASRPTPARSTSIRRSAASSTRSRRAPSLRSRSPSSTWPAMRAVPRPHRVACAFRCWRRSCRSRACGTPSSWPTRCRASACPRRSWIACDARKTPDGRARKGWRSRASS